jgi:hypothetical protein
VSGWLHARFALQYDVVVNLRDTSMQQSRRIRLAMAITGAIGAGFLLPVATDVTKGTIGRQMDSIRVPPVIELSEEEATKRLMEAGFPKVSTKVQKRFPADGKVFQQAPGAGHSARRDAEVTLFVREVAGSTPAEPVRRKTGGCTTPAGKRHTEQSRLAYSQQRCSCRVGVADQPQLAMGRCGMECRQCTCAARRGLIQQFYSPHNGKG